MRPLEENEILIVPEYNDQGQAVYRIPNAPKEKNLVAICPQVASKVVPVIFLPGVMGTNLCSNEEGKSLWYSNLPLALDTAWEWLLKSPQQRKQQLSPLVTKVDHSGNVLHNAYEGKVFPSRKKRGWGAALYHSYGDTLHALQCMLHDYRILFDNLEFARNRPTPRQLLTGKDLGAEKGEEPLTEEEVKHSYEFLFPLHVFGYNWLQSNADSSEQLGHYIKSVLNTYATRLAVNKVILITHSMGGLVARHYSKKAESRETILGVVHGVMPDIGSPSAYRRMKIGEQSKIGLVIGNSAEKLMPVLAQSPGPLQLLPGKAYGHGWLRIQNGSEVVRRPAVDPYEEIYLNQHDWWRLYEAGISGGEPKDEWDQYKELMTNEVMPFIENLHGKYHPNTWAFYGASTKLPSDQYLLWKQTHYIPDSIEIPPSGQRITTVAIKGYEPGNRIIIPVPPTQRKDYEKKRQYQLTSSESPGDGTVPVLSGRLHWSGIRSLLAAEVDHEGAFESLIQNGEETALALNFTLRAVIKMVQELPVCGGKDA